MKVVSEKAKAILVLKRNKGDFACINILDLPISKGIDASTIIEIDNFTKIHTENEIKEEISNLNIVGEEYKNGDLELLVEFNRLLPVLTIDHLNRLEINTFIEQNINNNSVLNTIYAFIVKQYNLNYKLLELLKLSIKTKDVKSIITILYNLTYMEHRGLYFYLYKKYIENDNSRTLNRIRKQD